MNLVPRRFQGFSILRQTRTDIKSFGNCSSLSLVFVSLRLFLLFSHCGRYDQRRWNRSDQIVNGTCWTVEGRSLHSLEKETYIYLYFESLLLLRLHYSSLQILLFYIILISQVAVNLLDQHFIVTEASFFLR